MTTRRIGFIDYRLDNFHANTFLQLFHQDLKTRGWEVALCWAMDVREGRKWAADHKIRFASDVKEMRDCDGIMVLAPSNPETHLPLARIALPLGMPVYIDKTFAPDHETARRIFALADRHGVPVITSSALRCCASLRRLVAEVGKENVRHLLAWGGGSSFEEYAIHPLEMAVSVMGPKIRRLMRLTDGPHHQVQLEFSDGRTASVFVHANSACGFQAMVSTNQKTAFVDCNGDPFFRDLCGLVLDFFEAGKEIIDRKESLMLRRILDAASSRRAMGRFVRV